jgi:hypothetical protein
MALKTFKAELPSGGQPDYQRIVDRFSVGLRQFLSGFQVFFNLWTIPTVAGESPCFQLFERRLIHDLPSAVRLQIIDDDSGSAGPVT